MLISVCTATNDPSYLLEAHQSLQAQSGPSWEWSIASSGPEIPESITADKRVKITKIIDGTAGARGSIGAMKKAAFAASSGDLLIDFDHDDVLEQGCLQAMADAIPDVGRSAFYYGSSAGFRPDGSSPTLRPDSVWSRYSRSVGQHTLLFHIPPTPSPISLADHLTVPHQPRAWTRSAYQKLGGHDDRLSYATDHDLICRTYCMGIPMTHIPEARSMFRMRADSGNAVRIRHKEFNQEAARNRWTHLRPMAARWCRDNKLPAMVITCRKQDKLDVDFYQWHSVDRHIVSSIDEAVDATRGSRLGVLMLPDLLHLIPAGEAINYLNKLKISVVDGGWILTDTPCSSGRGAADPMARSLWNEYTFSRLCPKIGMEQVEVRHYYPTIEHKDWQIGFIRGDLYNRGDGNVSHHEVVYNHQGRE